ncbi:hypothetical protein CALVIDRAFT_222910 [Calocera viscosa TUFC12733]|uniref:F-box domain-containing protein n=1 Tax=Calocera viscosa (strain TUFC12733) TaxID=1330018 RepID=A0A167K6R8_CALVF|nr:hypothetical protein CALVIDRAFT_222910 [Calocera viscosa TUFC12733]
MFSILNSPHIHMLHDVDEDSPTLFAPLRLVCVVVHYSNVSSAAVSSAKSPPSLNYDVLYLILSHVDDKRDLVNACCTNRAIREIAERHLYRVIKLRRLRHLALLYATLSRRHDLASRIDELTLVLIDRRKHYRNDLRMPFINASLRLFCRFLSLPTHVKSITFGYRDYRGPWRLYVARNLFKIAVSSTLMPLKTGLCQAGGHQELDGLPMLDPPQVSVLTVLPMLQRLSARNAVYVVLAAGRPVREVRYITGGFGPLGVGLLRAYLFFLRDSAASITSLELDWSGPSLVVIQMTIASLPYLKELSLQVWGLSSDVCGAVTLCHGTLTCY